MKNILSSRLLRARTMACLSMDELAQKVGISKEAIRKYEHAESMPNSTNLIKLGIALGVKPDYFFRPEIYQVGSFEFRKKSKLGVKKIDQIKESVKDKLERYIELEDLLAIDDSFVNPLAELKIILFEDVEVAAEKLRYSWELGSNPISCVLDMLEDNHVKVIEIEESQDFDGVSAFVNQKIPVIVINKNFPIERKRFTLLHELGHLILNFSDETGNKDKEKYCNRFANAMLIPSKAMRQTLDNKRVQFSMEELVALQQEWGISIRAIMYRAKEIGIISEAKHKEFCIKLNLFPNIKEAVDKSRFCGNESSGRFNQLLYKALAREVISVSKASALSNISVEKINSRLSVI